MKYDWDASVEPMIEYLIRKILNKHSERSGDIVSWVSGRNMEQEQYISGILLHSRRISCYNNSYYCLEGFAQFCGVRREGLLLAVDKTTNRGKSSKRRQKIWRHFWGQRESDKRAISNIHRGLWGLINTQHLVDIIKREKKHAQRETLHFWKFPPSDVLESNPIYRLIHSALESKGSTWLACNVTQYWIAWKTYTTIVMLDKGIKEEK